MMRGLRTLFSLGLRRSSKQNVSPLLGLLRYKSFAAAPLMMRSVIHWMPLFWMMKLGKTFGL